MLIIFVLIITGVLRMFLNNIAERLKELETLGKNEILQTTLCLKSVRILKRHAVYIITDVKLQQSIQRQSI